MGFLREKYTKEYYTGRDEKGQPAGYGALGADEWRQGGILHEIREPIDLGRLEGADVLEIGFGRGESARYMLREKGVRRYVGVDFSDNARELAIETLASCDPARYRLETADALEFLRRERFESEFDAVFMLDTIEHIPLTEIGEILALIHKGLRRDGDLIIDTPFYPIAEDYIAQSCRHAHPSPTDLHPKTAGMHCSKYSRQSLLRTVTRAGLKRISDKQFRKRPPALWRRLLSLMKGGMAA